MYPPFENSTTRIAIVYREFSPYAIFISANFITEGPRLTRILGLGKNSVRGRSQTTFTRGGGVGGQKIQLFVNFYTIGNVNGGM